MLKSVAAKKANRSLGALEINVYCFYSATSCLFIILVIGQALLDQTKIQLLQHHVSDSDQSGTSGGAPQAGYAGKSPPF